MTNEGSRSIRQYMFAPPARSPHETVLKGTLQQRGGKWHRGVRLYTDVFTMLSDTDTDNGVPGPRLISTGIIL